MMNGSKWRQPFHKPYYNVNDSLSKMEKSSNNVLILLGSRGKGKTLAWKLQGIYNTLNEKKECIYLRRFYKSEILPSKRNYLNDILIGDERLKDVEMKIKGNELYVNDILSTRFIALTQSLQLKSVSYQNVNMIIFDEFLTLGNIMRGVDESLIFKEFLNTVFRDRDDIMIVLLANAISTTSKYFKLFGFDKPINPKRRFQFPKHSKKIMLEISKNDIDFQNHQEKSGLMQLLPPSEYKKYSIENQFIFENFDNIVKRRDIKGHINHIYTIIANPKNINVYGFNKYKYYLSCDDKEYNDSLKFTFDKELIIHNALLINAYSDIARHLTNAIVMDNITFSDMFTKKLFLANLKKIVATYY